MPILRYRDHLPKLGERVFVAPTAHLTGDLEAGDDCSFWFATAARGDVNFIRIGARTNVQDGTILHVTHETHPLVVGDDVVIGHSCTIHGCTLETACLIGIGARVLDGAVVESGAMVAAGALVPPRMRVTSGMLALGAPAKLVRPLSDRERDEIAAIAARYVGVKDAYLAELGRGY
jgi:carbonic anhydrase/acetyltransferase-like protein (isoleucine patch superfamily)